MSAAKVKCRCCNGRGTTDIPSRLERVFNNMSRTSCGKSCSEIVTEHHQKTGEVVEHTTMFSRLNKLVEFGLLTKKKIDQSSGGIEYIFFKEFD